MPSHDLNAPAIECTHLSFAYDYATVLRDVTFSLPKNSFTAIIGPNGGGKTTLVRLLLGFEHANEGKLSILGSSPKEARKDIGYVPQALHFDRFFPLSTRQLLLTGRVRSNPWWGSYSDEDHAAVEKRAKQLSLTAKLDEPVSSLSGGQLQRALIARALVASPSLLILDEPVAGVDPKAEEEVLSILEELRSSTTILLVTHHLNTVIHSVDRVLLVHKEAHLLLPEEVCKHYTVGLYHTPLIDGETHD